MFHVIEGGVVAFAFAAKIECHIQPSERRAQLVGNIRDQLPLPGDELFDPAGHGVKIANKVSEFILTAPNYSSGARAQVPCSEPLRYFA